MSAHANLEARGTPLYQKTIHYDYGDADRSALMQEVWEHTPWMVNAYTGGTSDDRDIEMRQWCVDHFGPEACPIHGRDGQWQRGHATIFGWTWFGFAKKEQMEEFEAHWPAPEDANY